MTALRLIHPHFLPKSQGNGMFPAADHKVLIISTLARTGCGDSDPEGGISSGFDELVAPDQYLYYFPYTSLNDGSDQGQQFFCIHPTLLHRKTTMLKVKWAELYTPALKKVLFYK